MEAMDGSRARSKSPLVNSAECTQKAARIDISTPASLEEGVRACTKLPDIPLLPKPVQWKGGEK